MIHGFVNNSRGMGVRSHQLILPSVVCSTHLSRKVADQVGAITFSHQHGCAIIGPDVAGVNDFFVALAGHPNVQSTLVLGLGCETLQGNELTEAITRNYPETEYVVIQESAGMAGALDSSIAAAIALQTSVERKTFASLRIGIEGFPDSNELQDLRRTLEGAGHQVVLAQEFKEPARNFAELIKAKAHVIISFPEPNQPPSGLPLIPVITVPNANSILYQALADDFDCQANTTGQELLEKVLSVANGLETKSEAKRIGDIVVPRMVRSV